MAETRHEMAFPFRGLNDSFAATDRPEGTTDELRNMRGFDPTNGLMRGAQRAGLKKFQASVVSGANAVQAISSINYSKNRVSYSMLDAPTQEWSKVSPSQTASYGSAVSSDGSLFVVDQQASVIKYNADGEQLSTFMVAAPSGSTIVPRLALDEFDNVYVAAQLYDNTNSFVYMYEPNEDGVYAQRYRITVEGVVADIAVKNDILHCAYNMSEPEEYGDNSYFNAYVSTYAGASSSSPMEGWSKEVPYPVRGIAVKSSGEVFATSPPSDLRQASLTGWQPSTIDWTPADLTNAGQRLHFWVDASEVKKSDGSAYSNGDTVQNLSSNTNRTDYNGSLAVGDSGGYDGLRKLLVPNSFHIKSTKTGIGDLSYTSKRKPPKYRSSLFGSKPGIAFDKTEPVPSGGTAMLSAAPSGNTLSSSYNRNNEYDTTKGTVDGELTEANSVLPSYSGAKFCTVMVVKLNDYDTGRQACIFSQQDDGTTASARLATYALHYNKNGADATSDAGKLVFTSEAVASSGYSGSSNPTEYDMIAAKTGDATDGVIVFSFCHTGSGTSTGVVRVNGRNMDKLTFKSSSEGDQSDSASICSGSSVMRESAGRFILGGTCEGAAMRDGATYVDEDGVTQTIIDDYYRQRRDWTDNIVTHANHIGYMDGAVAEVVTFLADSSGGINNSTTNMVPLGTSSGVAGAPGGDYYNSQNHAGAKEVEKVEGYLAHKWGVAHRFPTAAGSSDGLYKAHPYAATAPADSGVIESGFQDSEYNIALQSKSGITVKFMPTGDVSYALTGGGMGYGVDVNEEGEVFTVGPTHSEATNPTTGESEALVMARMFKDNGSSYSANSSDGAWVVLRAVAAEELAYEYPRLAHDSNGDFYWPVANSAKANHLRKLSRVDGTQVWEHTIEEDQQTYSVAFPPLTPLYNDDSVTGQEFLYLTSDNGGDTANPDIRKLRLVSAAQDIADGSSTRSSLIVAVADGDIKKVNRHDGSSSVASGDSALNADAPYVSIATAFGKAYITDGVSYKYVDPSVAGGTAYDWTAKKAGEIPKRGKLLSHWRGRMVIAHTADNPHAWYMSAIANPEDWDEYPSTIVATQAISGANARCGNSPDVINALIPYSDDLMFFGGDHSTWRLTGDPMAGGQFDLVSETVGMSFGSPWCKDRDGLVYFFSSQGGVYAIQANGQMSSLTDGSISRRLEGIDLSKYRVEMVWNDREQGLHLYQIPYRYLGQDRLSYFWDKRLNAWYEDSYSTASMQPSASVVVDGDDPDDRELIFGGHDGYVRRWDDNSRTDDGSTVDSYVTIGPLVTVEHMNAIRFKGICAELASEQDGVRLELYASPSADVKGEPFSSLDLTGGRSGKINARAKGASLWARMRNARNYERWALEALSVGLASAGRKRVR